MRAPARSSGPTGYQAWSSTGGAGRAADLVFRGGTVYTADAAHPSATAVAVREGRIVYVGNDQGVEPFVAASTRIIDLQGGMLLPGFHDSHVHIVQGGLGLASCDLSMNATAQAVATHIAACARDNPKAAWVIGRGWQLGVFPNANPTRSQLDAIVSDRPAFFMAADGHSAWVNSRSLAAAGITASTPDPQGGRIEHFTTIRIGPRLSRALELLPDSEHDRHDPAAGSAIKSVPGRPRQ